MNNNFEKLCQLASKNCWCWRIYCTTCGCSQIRAGFFAIANDIELCLESIDSIIRTEDYRNLDYLNASKIIESVSKSNLDVIQKKCQFPDWLGYIGLIYHLIIPISLLVPVARKELTESLCPQFIKLLHSNTNAYKRIDNIIKSNYSIPFSIGLLEKIEKDILLNRAPF